MGGVGCHERLPTMDSRSREVFFLSRKPYACYACKTSTVFDALNGISTEKILNRLRYHAVPNTNANGRTTSHFFYSLIPFLCCRGFEQHHMIVQSFSLSLPDTPALLLLVIPCGLGSCVELDPAIDDEAPLLL